MYVPIIDAKNHKFIIEDRNGNVIAERQMPSWKIPYPPQEELMKMEGNEEAWQEVLDLVEAAND